jgi:hypothetical protein
MTSWDMRFPGHSAFTFTCHTPDGTLRTGRAEVNIKEVYPDSLDFIVESSEVKAILVRPR